MIQMTQMCYTIFKYFIWLFKEKEKILPICHKLILHQIFKIWPSIVINVII